MGDDEDTTPMKTLDGIEVDETDKVFVTALPKGHHDQGHKTSQLEQIESQEDFFADIGYYKFLNESDPSSFHTQAQDVFSKLQSTVIECQQREKSVRELELNLKQARTETAEASKRDAVDQKRNDELVEEIRAKEENAKTIFSSMGEKRVLIERLEIENEDLKRTIDAGPGWTQD